VAYEMVKPTYIASRIYDSVADNRPDFILQTRIRIRMIIGLRYIFQEIVTDETKQTGTLIVMDIVWCLYL